MLLCCRGAIVGKVDIFAAHMILSGGPATAVAGGARENRDSAKCNPMSNPITDRQTVDHRFSRICGPHCRTPEGNRIVWAMFFKSGGDRIRTCDLEVMSLTLPSSKTQRILRDLHVFYVRIVPLQAIARDRIISRRIAVVLARAIFENRRLPFFKSGGCPYRKPPTGPPTQVCASRQQSCTPSRNTGLPSVATAFCWQDVLGGRGRIQDPPFDSRLLPTFSRSEQMSAVTNALGAKTHLQD
jgi:hypothetical protein